MTSSSSHHGAGVKYTLRACSLDCAHPSSQYSYQGKDTMNSLGRDKVISCQKRGSEKALPGYECCVRTN